MSLLRRADLFAYPLWQSDLRSALPNPALLLRDALALSPKSEDAPWVGVNPGRGSWSASAPWQGLVGTIASIVAEMVASEIAPEARLEHRTLSPVVWLEAGGGGDVAGGVSRITPPPPIRGSVLTGVLEIVVSATTELSGEGGSMVLRDPGVSLANRGRIEHRLEFLPYVVMLFPAFVEFSIESPPLPACQPSLRIVSYWVDS